MAYHMASGASCIVTYLEAAKQAGTLELNAVRDALAAIDFECFYGRIKFTEDGDGDPSLLGPMLMQRQGESMAIISPQDAATAEAIYPAPAWSERG